jgi:hypothetical protein
MGKSINSNSSEDDIRIFIVEKLRASRDSVSYEKKCTGNGGRYDILSKRYGVIEVKRILSRNYLYQALGQGYYYQKSLKKKKLVLAGFAPIKDRESIIKLAEDLKETLGIEVWFLNLKRYSPDFLHRSVKRRVKRRRKLNALGWLSLGLGFLIGLNSVLFGIRYVNNEPQFDIQEENTRWDFNKL